MADTLSIAIAQVNMVVGDLTGNADRIIETAMRARDDLECQCVVFPELAITGYPPEDLLLRPAFIERSHVELDRVRAAVSGIALVVGYPLRTDGYLYNAASLIHAGEVLGTYRKQCLPNYSVFDEKRYFVAGDAPCVVNLDGVRIGITICEDIWQNGPIEQAKQAQADLVVNINASPFHIERPSERFDIVSRRARDNALPIMYVNMVGGQDELVFDGASFVVDRHGMLTQRCAHFDDALVRVNFEKSPVLTQHAAKIVAEEPLEQSVYRAIVCGVRDYVTKNGFKGAVIGLSGGIDSALTLAVTVDALGADNVEAVLMPSRYTLDMSIADAKSEAEALGVEYHVISIEPPFDAFLTQLQPVFGKRPMDVTEENIQARCRGVLLMAISNKTGKIVITTGNKSEMAVGYATLYGDMAGGFAAIKDVPKTLVYKLAAYRNGISPVIPERVLERPPSAELAPDQKDEDTLPPYEVLDPILGRYIEQDQSPEDIIAAGFEPDVVYRVAAMVDANEYKRRQAAPGVRITQRAFGRDRRYPLTSKFRSRPDAA